MKLVKVLYKCHFFGFPKPRYLGNSTSKQINQDALRQGLDELRKPLLSTAGTPAQPYSIKYTFGPSSVNLVALPTTVSYPANWLPRISIRISILIDLQLTFQFCYQTLNTSPFLFTKHNSKPLLQRLPSLNLTLALLHQLGLLTHPLLHLPIY